MRNIEVYNPTTNTLNVRWEAAKGPVQGYRVVYSPVNGARPTETVSFYFTESVEFIDCAQTRQVGHFAPPSVLSCSVWHLAAGCPRFHELSIPLGLRKPQIFR